MENQDEVKEKLKKIIILIQNFKSDLIPKPFKLTNFFLFGVFLVLLSLFQITKSPYVLDYDNWFHMEKIFIFIETGALDTSYLSYLIQFLFGIFILLSKLNIFMLGRAISLIQIPLGTLIFFLLIKRNSHGTSIAILGSLFFILSTLGPLNVLSQLWPTALIFLFMFQIEEIFLSQLHQIEKNQKIPLKDWFICVLLLYGMIVLHIASSYVILTPILFISFMLFIRDYRYGRIFLFYGVVFIVNILINYQAISRVILPEIIEKIFANWILIIVLIFGVLLIFYFMERKINRWTYATSSTTAFVGFSPLNSTISLTNKWFFSYIFPSILSIGPIIFIYLIMKNSITAWFSTLSISLMITTITLFVTTAIFGVNICRQYSLFGKIYYLKFLIIGVLLLAEIILSINSFLITRTITHYSFNLYIGFFFFAGYYFEVKQDPKMKRFTKIVFIIAIFSTLGFETTRDRYWKPQEIVFIQNFASHIPMEEHSGPSSRILGNFRWNYPFGYYSPENVDYNRNDSYLIHPENHFSGSNFILADYQANQNISNLYFIIDETYFTQGIILLDGKEYEKLDHSDLLYYFSCNYADIVQVSNSQQLLIWIHPSSPK